MTTPQNEHSNPWALGEELLLKASEINRYAGPREGEYARRKTQFMLGKMATAYARTPVFVDAVLTTIPHPDGVGIGFGELAGTITGFAYGEYRSEMEQTAKNSTGVIMHIAAPGMNDMDAEDADEWRLNVLPEELRRDIDGFVIGVPLIEGQRIQKLGEPKQDIEPDTIINGEVKATTYNYQDYVDKIQALLQNRMNVHATIDVAKVSAVHRLIREMVTECPYLNEIVAVQSDYIRYPKPRGQKGYNVAKGMIAGRLRKFIYAPYQDYETGKWYGDVQAVLWDAGVTELVRQGRLTAQEADSLPSTAFVPLSKKHILIPAEPKNN